MKIIDISTPIAQDIPIWPKVPKPRLSRISSIKKGDNANDTKIEMSIHSGTHIDAPNHFVDKGKTVDQLKLNVFMGQAFVAHLPKVRKITARDLESLDIPKGTTRLLFKTSNSALWAEGVKKFKKDYVGLTAEAAHWIVKKRIELVGIDYISISDFYEAVLVHQILLKKEVAILEGLDLSKVKPGTYHLVALPIKIAGAEGAPARALLVR